MAIAGLSRILMIGSAGFCIKEELVLKVTTAGSPGGRKNRFVYSLP